MAAGNHETSMRVVDAVIRAMEGVIPDRLTAGGPATSGLLAFAEPLADGGWRMLYEVHGGGRGRGMIATAARRRACTSPTPPTRRPK